MTDRPDARTRRPRPVPLRCTTARRRSGPARSLLVAGLAVLVVSGLGSCGRVPSGRSGGLGAAAELSAADGYIPRGESVGLGDDHLAAIANLDPALLGAVRRAAVDAAADGIDVRVTSGWRSVAYQRFLAEDAAAREGSGSAARTVLPPERSRHVTGHAIDIGPTDAADWMSRHGSDHGLCQVYANELWHYELLTRSGGTCPEMRPDASS